MVLNLHSGVGLKSDLVRIRSGFGGDEPCEVIPRFKKTPREWERLTICINTWYSEIAGGFYLNRYIISEIQCILQRRALYIVSRELFSETDICPIECFGSLMEDENYVLAAHDKVVGSLSIWAFGVGGASAFYKDACVLDFAMTTEALEGLESCLAKELEAKKVQVEVFAPCKDVGR